MQLLIVTGMSGAGKSTALKLLEDLGYFCVDNLPPALIPKFAEVCFGDDSEIEKVALGIDIRGGKLFKDLFLGLKSVQAMDYSYKILYLDSSDEVLLKRYKETRRTHPLAKNDRIITGIEKERRLLADVRSKATYIIDSSQILPRQLKEQISKIFIDDINFDNILITIISFGFKYGVPTDSDLVLDVRFIPNPFYIPELKLLTGNDKPVIDYVLNLSESKEFLNKINDLLDFLIPNYVKEGKNQLVISIGCTGGKHRSVALSNELCYALQMRGHSLNVSHRDIYKDNIVL